MKLTYECDPGWDDLDGSSDVRRHCGECDRDVFNLSNMTRKKAERVLALFESEGVCVHFVSRGGRIIHDGDPLEQLRSQRRGAGKLLAFAVAVQAAMVLGGEPVSSYFDPFAWAANSIEVLEFDVEVTEPEERLTGAAPLPEEVTF